MSAVIASLVMPFDQILDRGFRGPLIKGVLGAMLTLGLLILLAGWGVEALAGGSGWLATAAGVLGGVAGLFAAFWLFVPFVLAIAGLFLDETAAAVERRHYPGLPEPRGASLAAQGVFNVVLALKVLALNLVLLPVALLLPLVGGLLLWIVAAVSLGHGLFEGVAQRRMPVAEARVLRKRREFSVLVVGAVLAGMALVPFANLLVPVLGTAAMVHLLHRGADGPVR
ncbi:EI24 domain-containing protein [Roseomonas xinghualingensis]|uniref:EI24 domain-containing protein n=1 Tax=Roseomonas xinghualingensis TaxID=2986475 RepID=UPI0021F1ECEC|nr:EI24 domain-containing protein [Roseomonas sp. SXEYE001]MCV4207326.1 EI24 domain-containing protein [Roseomonas sp. SXEYE001]